eukprot:5151273-Alexandrium_andersonii.AAC.1
MCGPGQAFDLTLGGDGGKHCAGCPGRVNDSWIVRVIVCSCACASIQQVPLQYVCVSVRVRGHSHARER